MPGAAVVGKRWWERRTTIHPEADKEDGAAHSSRSAPSRPLHAWGGCAVAQGTILLRKDDTEGGYEVIRQIGSGSFAQVFLVTHIKERQQYVMKEVLSFGTMDQKQRDAMELEVKLLHAIQHPSVVAYRDSFVNQGGHLCIFMEYCEHGDMHSYLQNAKEADNMPSEARVLEWFVQASLALDALHSRKILHRDLKTHNIFLTGCNPKQKMSVKLGDLGVARVLTSTMELAMTQIGTPFYMSPELFNSKPYGYKSDVWGLGCVLYEFITGHHAFDAQSINALALRILRGRYTPISTSCSDEVKDLIHWMLKTNPDHRPTLKQVMLSPVVKRHIQEALGTMIEAAPDGTRKETETLLVEQLGTLGLSRAHDGSITGPLPARRSRRQPTQLSECALHAHHEEDTLERLCKTAARLHEFNGDTPQRTSSSFQGMSPAFSPNDTTGSFPPATARSEPLWTDRSEDIPAMTHRDRVLRRKERQREEEQHRFEEEARKIREENLAYQRAWVQGSKEPFGSDHWHFGSERTTPLLPRPSPDSGAGRSPSQRMSALPGQLTPLSSGGTQQGVQDHSAPSNPFQSCRANVVHSKRMGRDFFQSSRRHLRTCEVAPPPLQYQEPSLPPDAPQHSWSRWCGNDQGPPLHASRSVQSVCLEALAGHLPRAEQSEDSDGSISPSDAWDDGGRSPCAHNVELSHRDRVLLRKERRKEQEQLRFEKEARKIREENLAYQRAWVQGAKDPFSQDTPQGAPTSSQSAGGAPRSMLSPSRSRELYRQLPERLTPLSPLVHADQENPSWSNSRQSPRTALDMHSSRGQPRASEARHPRAIF